MKTKKQIQSRIDKLNKKLSLIAKHHDKYVELYKKSLNSNKLRDIFYQRSWKYRNKYNEFYHTEDARDFLVRRKFYILFDNPCADKKTQKIIFNPFVRRTEIQTNKIFNLIKHSDELTNIMLQKLSEVK